LFLRIPVFNCRKGLSELVLTFFPILAVSMAQNPHNPFLKLNYIVPAKILKAI